MAINIATWNARIPLAQAIATLLKHRDYRLVLVESCTCGNVVGSLAVVPGISQWLCGGLASYRNDSKHQWLDIPQSMLDDPAMGPVSAPVTGLLAQQALVRTPEATVAAAVTGHLGPGSPADLDGRVYFSCCTRNGGSTSTIAHVLKSPQPADSNDIASRALRIEEATLWVLEQVRAALQSS